MKTVILLFVLAFLLSINAQVKDSLKVDNFQKTDEVLTEVVKKALLVAEKTGNFVLEQAPLLLQEFYRWRIFNHIFYIILGLVIFCIGRYAPSFWLKKESDSEYNLKFFGKYNSNTSYWDEKFSCSWALFCITSIISFFFIVSNLYNLTFLLVSPKLYLIEYFIK